MLLFQEHVLVHVTVDAVVLAAHTFLRHTDTYPTSLDALYVTLMPTLPHLML